MLYYFVKKCIKCQICRSLVKYIRGMHHASTFRWIAHDTRNINFARIVKDNRHLYILQRVMSLFTRSCALLQNNVLDAVHCSLLRPQKSNFLVQFHFVRPTTSIKAHRRHLVPVQVNNIDHSNRRNNVPNYVQRQPWQARRWWLCMHAKCPLNLTLVAVFWTVSISRGFQ